MTFFLNAKDEAWGAATENTNSPDSYSLRLHHDHAQRKVKVFAPLGLLRALNLELRWVTQFT